METDINKEQRGKLIILLENKLRELKEEECKGYAKEYVVMDINDKVQSIFLFPAEETNG